MPTDTPALLPPDPSKPGEYWLIRSGRKPEAWTWDVDDQSWVRDHGNWHPQAIVLLGYTLASPHPIPSPAALEALHALPDAIVQAEREASADAPNDYKIVGIGAAKNAAAMLHRALETKETT